MLLNDIEGGELSYYRIVYSEASRGLTVSGAVYAGSWTLFESWEDMMPVWSER